MYLYPPTAMQNHSETTVSNILQVIFSIILVMLWTCCIYIANVLGSNALVFPGSSAPQSPQVSGLSSAPTCVRVFPDRSACPCPGSNVSRWACHHHQPDDMWHVTCPRCPGSLWPAALCPSSSAPTCAPMCTGARWLIAWLEKYFLKGVYDPRFVQIEKNWKSLKKYVLMYHLFQCQRDEIKV